MIKIEKGIEPKAWTEKCATPGFTYSSIPELRDALLIEQGYICAYCMCRIDEKKSKIEHIKSKAKNKYPELQLKYTNMVICCEGETDGNTHCDTKKDDNDISFDLFSDGFFKTLSYRTKAGSIRSSNSIYNNEINNILNLNHKAIQWNRKKVIESIIPLLVGLKWTDSNLKKQLKKYRNRDKNNKLAPYSGIVIWYLSKKLLQKN